MNALILFAALAALVTVALAWLVSRNRRNRDGLVWFANIAEGFHQDAILGYLTPDAAFTTRFLVCKRGSAADKIAICTATDVPLGVVTDETPVSGDLTIPLAVACFGGACGATLKVQAGAANSGVIAQDSLVVADAAGQVKVLPAGAGTYYIIGRALNAAAAQADIVEIVPLFQKHII